MWRKFFSTDFFSPQFGTGAKPGDTFQTSQSSLMPATSHLGSANPQELAMKNFMCVNNSYLSAEKNPLVVHKLGRAETQGFTRLM